MYRRAEETNAVLRQQWWVSLLLLFLLNFLQTDEKKNEKRSEEHTVAIATLPINSCRTHNIFTTNLAVF